MPDILRTHSRLDTVIVYASGSMRFMAYYTRQAITWIVVLKILAQSSDQEIWEAMESLPAQQPLILRLMVSHSGSERAESILVCKQRVTRLESMAAADDSRPA